MSVVTPVVPPVVCTRCRESRPSWEFQENYGGIPGLRVCTRCNSCPDCGLRLGDGRLHTHRCQVPLLKAALGVELTPREKRLIGWLATSIEPSDAGTLAELFRRCSRRDSSTP